MVRRISPWPAFRQTGNFHGPADAAGTAMCAVYLSLLLTACKEEDVEVPNTLPHT